MGDQQSQQYRRLDQRGALTAYTPGVYKVQTKTSYASPGPGLPPPAPTILNYSFPVKAPDSVSKGGAVGVPTSIWSAVQLADPVTSQGYPIGPDATIDIQELIMPWRWWDGSTIPGVQPWGPSSAEHIVQFHCQHNQ